MFVNWMFCDVKQKLDHLENNRIYSIHIYTVHTVFTRYIRITYLFIIQEVIKRHFQCHWRYPFLFKSNHLYRRVVHALHIKPFICLFTLCFFILKYFDEDDYIGYKYIKELVNRQTGKENLTAMVLERLIDNVNKNLYCLYISRYC